MDGVGEGVLRRRIGICGVGGLSVGGIVVFCGACGRVISRVTLSFL